MNEFKVGLLALATMASIVFMSLKVTSNQSGFGEYVLYKTIISDASGIFPKTPIKVAGINAGRIRKIELLGNKALITFEVLSNIKVTVNSLLKIKSVGFLGDKFLEIYIGNQKEMINENGFIISEEGGGMENIVRDTSVVLEDVKIIINSIKNSLVPAGEEAPLSIIVRDTEKLVSSMQKVTQNLEEMIVSNRDDLESMMGNFNKFAQNLAFQSDDAAADSAMSQVNTILGNVDSISNNVELLVENVNKGQGTIGKFLVDDGIANNIEKSLNGVNKLLGRVDAVRTELAVFSGVNSYSGSYTDARIKVLPSPERFYLLGASTSKFGIETVTHESTINNGVENNVITKVKEEDTFRFNIQLGRKIHQLSLRGGIIESTGGLGADYDFSLFRSRITMDIFNYRKSLGPNLRFASEFQMWNVIYGKLVLDDVILDRRNATISAGIRFNDEDLKGIMGFFF